MPKVPYPKQIQTFANQIGILKQRGMTFADEAAAKAWLHRVSYYRMSGYWYPLLADRVNHTFKPGTTFERPLVSMSLIVVCASLYFEISDGLRWQCVHRWLM